MGKMKAEITDIVKEQDKVILVIDCCCPPVYDLDNTVLSSNLLMALHTQCTTDIAKLHRGEVELKQELE